MSHYLARGSAAAFAYVLATQGALADLTAQDVWAEWRSYMADVGYQVSATEAMSGNDLTVSDFSASMMLPEQAGTFSIAMPDLALRNNGDGTVTVMMPARIPMRFEVTEEGETVTGEIGIGQSDSALVVSGTPADMTFAYSTAQMTIGLDSLTVDGEAIPPEIGRMIFTLANVDSSSRMMRGAMRDYTQTLNADSLRYDMAFKNPDSGEKVVAQGEIQGITFDGSGSIPLVLDTADFPKMLADGLGFAGKFGFTGGSGNLAATATGDDFSYSSTSSGGSLAVAMDASHIAYDASQTGTTINVAGAEIPFPVSLQMQEVGFSLDMPVARSDDAQPFAFGMTLADFTMPDMLWGIFDPGAILPRDPATVVFDVTGKARVLFDLLNPETAKMLEETGAAPGELHALSIGRLLVSMVGAELSGTGDFTFDNSDLVSFDGMPKPTGKADLKLIGANGLIDKLIQMGFVSDQDAMGARMMMGMLAVPGDAPDTLKSSIEINDQGHIIANGQRIK